MKSTRIFVGGLNEDISEEDVTNKLFKFGKVVSFEKKVKTDQLGSVKTFAFVNVEASQNDINSCVTRFNGSEWKGMKLTVQIAKESYLDRLKREREENAALENKKEEVEAVPEVVKKKPKAKVIAKKESSSEDSSSDEEEEVLYKGMKKFKGLGMLESPVENDTAAIAIKEKVASQPKGISYDNKWEQNGYQKQTKRKFEEENNDYEEEYNGYENEEYDQDQHDNLFDGNQDCQNLNDKFQQNINDERFQMDEAWEDDEVELSKFKSKGDPDAWKYNTFAIHTFKKVKRYELSAKITTTIATEPEKEETIKPVSTVQKNTTFVKLNKDSLNSGSQFSLTSMFSSVVVPEENNEVLEPTASWNPFAKERETHIIREELEEFKVPKHKTKTNHSFLLFTRTKKDDEDDNFCRAVINRETIRKNFRKKKFSNKDTFVKKSFANNKQKKW